VSHYYQRMSSKLVGVSSAQAVEGNCSFCSFFGVVCLDFFIFYEDDHVFELVLLMSLSIHGDVSLVLAVFFRDMLLYACFQCT